MHAVSGVIRCAFQLNGAAWVCAVCGRSVPAKSNAPPVAVCRPGLGDMVKAGLSAVGITEERVSRAIGRPCGCSKRAAKLNELGRKFGIG